MAATTVFDDLRDALAEQEFDGAAVGIDLGTTKSCIAVARFEEDQRMRGALKDAKPKASAQRIGARVVELAAKLRA